MHKIRLTLLLVCIVHSIVTTAISRIVSLAPSLTMNLYYLGLKNEIVGCTSYCEIAKPDNKTIVASAIKVNIEKVYSLKPDLVIVSTITPPETIETLKKLGLHVEIFPTPKSFDEICQQFSRLAKLVDKSDIAIGIIKQTRQKVDSIAHENEKYKKSKIFFQIGTKPIFTVLPNTFLDDYIQFCGGINIASDLKSGIIGRELVLQRNPEIIIIVTMGIIGIEEKNSWRNFPDLNAVKQNNIIVIDSNLACTPTPISFLTTLENINNQIDKQLWKKSTMD